MTNPERSKIKTAEEDVTNEVRKKSSKTTSGGFIWLPR